MRGCFAIAVLASALCACGTSRGDSASHTSTGDAAPDAPPDTEPQDSGAEEPPEDAGADLAPIDARPPCPPVDGGTALQAAFTEKRIAVGTIQTCGIRADGTVQCWGSDFYGQASPPPGTFTRVSAGNSHTCGIRTSGEVECWGGGKTLGKCENSEDVECGQSIAPPGRFVELAAGDALTCGLHPDLTIECWGANLYGETEPPCGRFIQMSASPASGCAVTPDAKLECWPSPERWYVPGMLEPRDEPVKQVSLGTFCACILYESGAADCRTYITLPIPPFTARIEQWLPEGVAAVACGDQGACAILDDGTVDCCHGTNPSTGPVGTFVEISCGFSYCCGLRADGMASCWGDTNWFEVPPDFRASSQ